MRDVCTVFGMPKSTSLYGHGAMVVICLQIVVVTGSCRNEKEVGGFFQLIEDGPN